MQKIMSQRSAGSCARCTRANTFPESAIAYSAVRFPIASQLLNIPSRIAQGAMQNWKVSSCTAICLRNHVKAYGVCMFGQNTLPEIPWAPKFKF